MEVFVPVKSGLGISNVSYLPATRTTICDIMCTINTYRNYDNPKPEEGIEHLSAVLPYKKQRNTDKANAGPTKFQKFKLAEYKEKKIEAMLKERDDYFKNLAEERKASNNRKSWSVIRIQALFRGYLRRKRKGILYLPKRKQVVVLTQNQMQDELCRMASEISLDPIAGLSLEARSKTSRRKNKIENAAAFRLQRFFKMLYQRSIARAYLEVKRDERMHKCARTITKAVRFMKTKNFLKRCEQIKKSRSAIKIQMQYRIYVAKNRVRMYRRYRDQKRQRNEAAIIIQRNCATKYREMNFARVTMINYRHFMSVAANALELIQETLINEMFVNAVEKIGLQWDRKLLPALDKLEEDIIEHLISRSAEKVGVDRMEEQLLAILMENERITKERHAMEEHLASLNHSHSHTGENTPHSARHHHHTHSGDHHDHHHHLGGLHQDHHFAASASAASFEKDLNSARSLAEDESSVVSFGDEKAPGFDFNASVQNFVGKVTSKVVSKLPEEPVLLDYDDVASQASLTEKGTVVSFQSDDSNFRASVTNFVGKIAAKAITRASIVSVMSTTAEQPEETRVEASRPPTRENLVSDSVADFVKSFTRKSVSNVAQSMSSSMAAAVSAVNAVPVAGTGVVADGSSQIVKVSQLAHTFVGSSINLAVGTLEALLAEPSSDDLLQPPEDGQTSASGMPRSRADFPCSQVRGPCLTDTMLNLLFNKEEKRSMDDLLQKAYTAHYCAEFNEAITILLEVMRLLDESSAMIDKSHPEFQLFQSRVKLMLANVYYTLADYGASKELYDEILEVRVTRGLPGVSPVLVMEIQYHLAEWFRSQADYNNSELYFVQAKGVAEAEIARVKTNFKASLESPDHHFHHLHARILIGYTELLKNRGQYYKANAMIATAQECVRANKQRDIVDFEVQVELVICLISLFVIKGKYANAVSLHQELLDKRRMHYGLSHPKVATSMNSLGALMLMKCEFAEASRLIDESLEMRMVYYPVDHPSIASSLYTRAQGYIAIGKYAEGLNDVTNALEMRSRLLGSTHPSVASCLNVMATAQTLMGQPVEGVMNYHSCLAIRKERFGTELHRDVAETIFLMAINAEMRGCYDESIGHYDQALQLRQELMPLYGKDVGLHLDLELSKVYLAHMYINVNRINEAKDLMKQAVKNVCSILGNNHTLVSKCLCFLGELCKIRGNYTDAKTLFSISFNVIDSYFGDTHPEIAQIMQQSSDNFRIPGCHQEAVDLATSALELSTQLYGLDSILVAQAECVRARALRDSGRLEEAEQIYSHALNCFLVKLGESSCPYGIAFGELAECYRMQGKVQQAEKAFHEALAVQKNVYGENSLIEADTLCNFSLFLIDMRNLEEAHQLIHNTVLPLYKMHLGEQHIKCAFARANLALCSQLLGSGSDSVSGVASLNSAMLEHGDILDFLEVCKQCGFVDQHAWVQRFTWSHYADKIMTGGAGGYYSPRGGGGGGDHSVVSYTSLSRGASRGGSRAESRGGGSRGGSRGGGGGGDNSSLEGSNYYTRTSHYSSHQSYGGSATYHDNMSLEGSLSYYNPQGSYSGLDGGHSLEGGSYYDDPSRGGVGGGGSGSVVQDDFHSESGTDSRYRRGSGSVYTPRSGSVGRHRQTMRNASNGGRQLRNRDAESSVDDSWEQQYREDGSFENHSFVSLDEGSIMSAEEYYK